MTWGSRDADASIDMQKRWAARLGMRRLLPYMLAWTIAPSRNAALLREFANTYNDLCKQLHPSLLAVEETGSTENVIANLTLMELQLWQTSGDFSESLG